MLDRCMLNIEKYVVRFIPEPTFVHINLEQL
jgi:hypothetical protein